MLSLHHSPWAFLVGLDLVSVVVGFVIGLTDYKRRVLEEGEEEEEEEEDASTVLDMVLFPKSQE